jgi:hypothetical protein
VIIIDPESEYKYLSDTVGGTYINISIGSDQHINPFDLPAPQEGESWSDVFRSHVLSLSGLIKLLMGGSITPEEDSLPKDITVTIKSEKDSSPRTITSVIKEITVGKGYKGSYTAKLETGDVISSMASEQVISMTINGVTYDKEQEKKVYNQKPAIDENAAKTLFTQFSALSKDDIIKITSTENRFNQTFKVLNTEIVHAPFKQCKITVQKADGNGPVAHFLSRRDSGIISKCEVQNMEEEEIVEEEVETSTIVSEPEETEINL